MISFFTSKIIIFVCLSSVAFFGYVRSGTPEIILRCVVSLCGKEICIYLAAIAMINNNIETRLRYA